MRDLTKLKNKGNKMLSKKQFEEKYNNLNVKNFYQIFDEELAKGRTSINTTIDYFSKLDETEFISAQEYFLKLGWKLIEIEDNYESYTYLLK